MPCSYCGIPGCAIDTCPERLEDKFGLPSKYISDVDGEDDETLSEDAEFRPASEGWSGP